MTARLNAKVGAKIHWLLPHEFEAKTREAWAWFDSVPCELRAVLDHTAPKILDLYCHFEKLGLLREHERLLVGMVEESPYEIVKDMSDEMTRRQDWHETRGTYREWGIQ